MLSHLPLRHTFVSHTLIESKQLISAFDFLNQTSVDRMAASNIKTRILVISDTHGKKPLETGSDETTNPPTQAYRYPLPKADIAIHCGDLTLGSNVEEFEATFSMIRALDAPLKLFERKEREDVFGGPGEWDNADKARAQCPKEGCNGDEAAFFQVQIRSADEPMTTFFKCMACGNRWREN
ncbi:hypothetical protein BN1708_000010 [Verticillium longisporum]|uniref:DNA-directed RNA polymerase III subunit RPC10 n=1 Tax=Verticillium longisporum TaxID=100787 RepID=A0A0G4KCP6_VERLO|nr:hypothetical protein BN1708_000010 [Verticillium longisporum]